MTTYLAFLRGINLNRWAVAALFVPVVCVSQQASDSAQVARIDRMTRSIDSLARLPHARISRLARLEDSTFRRFPDLLQLPAGTDEFYNLIQDRKGRVRRAFIVPMSQSGDWALSATYWFDSIGVTRLVEVSYGRETLCVDKDDESVSGAEVTRVYFDATHHIIHQTVRRTGGANGTTDLRALTNCVSADTSEYARYPTWESMAAATGLARAMQTR